MKPSWFEKPSCIQPGMAPHALLEASAGTGKTYVIERLVVEMLLEHEVPIEQVLVVTFTRRAAAEMAGRIRTCIEELLEGKGATSQRPNAWLIDDAKRGLLQRALANFDQAPISTIHQFCQRVLDEQEILTGRLPSGGAAAEPPNLYHEAFTQVLRRVAGTGSQQDLVMSQWAREHDGRKRTWVADLEGLLRKQVGQHLLLRPLVDDAKLAALQDQLLTALARPLPSAEVFKAARVRSTKVAQALLAVQAHAVAAGLLDASTLARLPGVTWDPRVYQLGFLPAMKALTVEDDSPNLRQYLSGSTPVAEPVLSLLKAVRELYLALPSRTALIVQTLLPDIAKRYEALCVERGVLTYDRLLTETDLALEKDQTGHLRARLQARYRAVLVDEFQDTDPTQWSILRRAFLGAGSKTRLIAVGDPKQAIYSFRGGDLATYTLARDGDGAHPGLTPLEPLTSNWRSTAAMVEACNRLFALEVDGAPFLGERAKSGLTYRDVKAGQDVGALHFDGQQAAPFGIIPLHIGTVEDARDLLRAAVVQKVKALLERGLLVNLPVKKQQKRVTRKVTAADIMVLVDQNRHAQAYVRDLQAAGISAEQYRAAGLMQSPEASQVLELVSALAAPGRSGSMLKAFRTFFFDVPLEELETAGTLTAEDPRLRQWNALVRAAEQRDWLELFGLLRESAGLRHRKSLTVDLERQLLTINAVLDSAHQLARAGCRDIAALASELQALVEADGEGGESNDDDIYPASEGPSAVRVLTTFKAKGLEAPIVFVAHAPRGKLGDGEFSTFHEPKTRRRLIWVGEYGMVKPVEELIADELDLEARRYQYVSHTRAQHQLWLPFFLKAGKPDTAQGEEGDEPPHRASDSLEGELGKDGPRYAATNQRLAVLLKDPGFRKYWTRFDDGEAGDDAKGKRQGKPGPCAAPASPPPVAPSPTPSPAEVRLTARGLGIESFSSLSLLMEDPPEKPLGARTKEGELPRGAGPGRAVHALLEDVPLEATKPGQAFEAWRAHPKVRPVLERKGALGRLEHTQRLVFHALHDPVTLPGGAVVHGLGTLGKRLHREAPFDLPWPSASNPFGSPVKGRWTIDRGFLTGIIDFAFEHDGRVYFGDWKSNSYPSYDADTLRRSVLGSYGGQVLIYSLALCRLYGIATEADYERRFGGALYVYLRGLLTPGQGLYAHRPRWRELARLDEALRKWSLPAELRPKLELVPDDEAIESDEDHDGEGDE